MGEATRSLSEGKFFLNISKKIKKANKQFWKYVDRALANAYNYMRFGHLPIDNHKIMMLTSRGTYNCHPRAIADEIIRQNLPYEIVWWYEKKILIIMNGIQKI